VLHLRDEARQRRLRRRRRQDQQELPGQVPQHREQVQAGDQLEQETEDHEHEDRAGDVEPDHDLGEPGQGLPARRAHHGGDRAERADRRHPHDHREDPEHQPLQVRDAAQDRLSRASHRLQRESGEQRDEQRLQHLAAGEGGEDRGRDDPEDEVGRALALGLRHLAAGVDVEAGAGVEDVADDEPDDQRDRRHDQEVAERQPADPADLRGLTDGPDAEHDRAEDDRADHHLDQVHEAVAERFQFLAEVGEQEPDQDPEEHGHDHREIEVPGVVAARRWGLRGALARYGGIRRDGGGRHVRSRGGGGQ
jgi:hypothetical protein